MIGFITGIYLPIGILPEAVQWVIKLFPISHATALMRQVMMENPVQFSFAGIPENYLTEFKKMVGVNYSYGEFTATITIHIAVLIGTAIVFFLLALGNVSRKNR